MTPIGLVLDGLPLRDAGRERNARGDVDGSWQRAMEQAVCAEWFKPWRAPDASDASRPPRPPEVTHDRWDGRLPGASALPVPANGTTRDEAASPRPEPDAEVGLAHAASTVVSPHVDGRTATASASANDATTAREGQANGPPGAQPEPASAVVPPLASAPAGTVVPAAGPVHRQATDAARATPSTLNASPLPTPALAPTANTPRPGPATPPAAATLAPCSPVTPAQASNAPVAALLETPVRRAAPAHGPGGLATAPLLPVRVHVDRHGDHADVWIGADAAVGSELADVVAGVARTLQRIGLVPRRIVCNGHAVPLPRPEQP